MRRLVRAVAVPFLALALSALLRSPAETVPQYAARTGNLCRTCHFDPNGGGPRNDFGFAFARNRHSLEPDPQSSILGDSALTNRIGENMPVYLGLDQRFMLLSNSAGPPNGPDRLGFFNMENAIYVAFQPHTRLTLAYAQDVSGQSATNTSRVRDAYGMLTGLPLDGYIRAGRFRNPFGLRMDDHTVATRNSFLDFGNQERFLPYDPRNPDMGVEVGMEHSGWFGRAAYTNGGATSTVLEDNVYAQAVSAKLGYNTLYNQSAVSIYDNYNREPVSGMPKRATRWGYYGMTHYGPFALLGEVAAGTDEEEPTTPGHATGPKTNRLAYWLEVDYTPVRSLNFRLRYDRLEYDRSSDKQTADLNTHERYALEGEYVPVPFCELRWTLRRIDHKNSLLYGYPDERQAYLQFHFSY